MPDRPRSRRAALLASAALTACALSVTSAAAAGSASSTGTTTGTGTTTIGGAPTPPTPHFAVNWDVLKERCETVTKRKRVKVHGHVKIEKKRVRRCTAHPVKTHSTHVHLAWRHHGVAFGHLTLAGEPIANATVAVSSKIARGATSTTTETTNAHGRFQLPLGGPNKTVTLSYTSTPGGAVYAKTAQITERAYLSFRVGHLKARQRGSFSGIVFGGHIPENLYVQFYYLAAGSGWQPFASLARVARHNGHWHASIKIPAAARGYTYKIRATVVPSPYWPYASTHSRVITRIGS